MMECFFDISIINNGQKFSTIYFFNTRFKVMRDIESNEFLRSQKKRAQHKVVSKYFLMKVEGFIFLVNMKICCLY